MEMYLLLKALLQKMLGSEKEVKKYDVTFIYLTISPVNQCQVLAAHKQGRQLRQKRQQISAK